MKLLKITALALAALGVSGQQVVNDPYSVSQQGSNPFED